jgi:hypothetical protein
VLNGWVSWIVQAPDQPTLEAVSIEARIASLPLDENTNDSAYVSKRNDEVAVTTVGGWLAVSGYTRPDTARGLLVPGEEDVWLMGLEFVNRGQAGTNPIVIHSASFHVEDMAGFDLSPDEALSSMRAVRMVRQADTTVIDWGHVFGELDPIDSSSDNPLTLVFTTPDTIRSTDTSLVAIVGDIAEAGQQLTFHLNLAAGSSLEALDAYNPDIAIPVLDASGKSLANLRSDPKQVLGGGVVQGSATPYLLNCPNPFGSPDREETIFIYYLRERTDVLFRVYTLTGSLVWSASYTQTDPQGAQGLHSAGPDAVVWDGRNDRGIRVLNGVYILVMETGTGDVAKNKIAVVK